MAALMELVKLPKLSLLFIVRVLLSPLNLIRSGVYEAIDRHDARERPDLRDLLAPVKGRRQLGLGLALVAWQRGVIFTTSFQGHRWRGVYKEDFEALLKLAL
jgi:hypothetical protein